MPVPYITAHIPAGFTVPTDDHLDTALDLNDVVVRHPEATYFVRVEGDSMVDAHISDGDILVVDRSLEPRNGDIVIAALEAVPGRAITGNECAYRISLLGKLGKHPGVDVRSLFPYQSAHIADDDFLIRDAERSAPFQISVIRVEAVSFHATLPEFDVFGNPVLLQYVDY